MFSTDLTSEELEPILQPVKVPILLCFSEQDEYVPDMPAQKKLAERMTTVLKKYSPRVECKYYPGNHALSEKKYYTPFLNDVLMFLNSRSVS